MFKHILVPLNESEDSQRAVAYAKEIIEPGGTIVLLTVLEDLVVYRYGQEIRYPASVEIEFIEKAGNYLRQQAKPLLDAGIKVQCLVRAGRPDKVIVRMAALYNVDALVMATSNPSGLRKLVFGSVTKRVIQKVDCPVFVVPPVEAAAAG